MEITIISYLKLIITKVGRERDGLKRGSHHTKKSAKRCYEKRKKRRKEKRKKKKEKKGKKKERKVGVVGRVGDYWRMRKKKLKTFMTTMNDPSPDLEGD